MRFNAAFTALVSSASLMGCYAQAEEPEAAPDAAAIDRPTFTVCHLRFNSLVAIPNLSFSHLP